MESLVFKFNFDVYVFLISSFCKFSFLVLVPQI